MERKAMTPREAQGLVTDVMRLAAAYASVRLESANRLAAMRAALSAAESGECDPLDFLRDEIGDQFPAGGRL